MSNGTTDLAGGGDPDVMLARALAQAVQEAGRKLAGDPRRVQGMVSDVLGAESRTRRAEIDAVVLAAEEAVPEDLLANRIDLDTALARLRGRGLDDGVARFAVEVWRYALGMLADDAEPPSLTNSLESSTRPGITDPAPDITDQFATVAGFAAFAPPTALPTDAATVLPDTPARPVVARATTGSKRGKAVWLLVGIPVLVLLVAFGAFLVLKNDDPTIVADEVSTTARAATTAATDPQAATFPVETTALGELSREWVVDDGVLHATLAFSNTTGADTTGRFYEVVPKSLAPTADTITSEPAHVVVKNDPVIAWDLTLPAGGTQQVTYEIDVPDDAGAADLDRWTADHTTETAAFATELAAAPSLGVATADGTVINVGEIDVSGTTDPSATITLNDTPVPVGADGTWTLHVGPGLAVGPNAFTVVATSRYGVTASASFSVIVQPDSSIPATTTTVRRATTTTVKPTGPAVPPVIATTTTAAPVIATTTTAAPVTTTTTAPVIATTTTALPAIVVSISGPGTVTMDPNGLCGYVYTLNFSGFTPATIDWVGGTTYDGQISSQFFFTTGTGLYTVSVKGTATDGRPYTAAKNVNAQSSVLPPGQPGYC